MNKWLKQPVSTAQTKPLCTRYNITPLLASIFVRRNITKNSELLYFLEDDLRFQHEPFSFNNMEDAVERILSAKEEGEKVLIFGDSDVDGITSTAILYEYLKAINLDVQWRLPQDDDPYGLTIKAIDDFYKENGTLIITVDCGISNNDEIEYAASLGIDVIVTDHHNPQEILPNAITILDPKIKDSGYSFDGISGACVAYKLVSGLRFAHTNFYNSDICIINAKQHETNSINIDCVKIRNLTKIKELHETINFSTASIYNTKLLNFLQGQLIYAWDSKATSDLLTNVFGRGIQFNFMDLRQQVSAVIPSLRNKTIEQIHTLSTSAKYYDNELNNTELESLFNLYISYCKKIIAQNKPEQIKAEKRDLQLVSLAALADIMPMKDENRIFIKNGLKTIKTEGPREGLKELFAKLNIAYQNVTSIDLSWGIIPALNAAGRLGVSNLALQLLISEDPKERETLASKIIELNEKRKEMVSSGITLVQNKALESLQEYNSKLCVIIEESINPGLTGLFAGKLMQDLKTPAIAITFTQDICIGSIRSCRGLIATDFLNKFENFFLNHGGHNFAAGFSFEKSKLQSFISKVKQESQNIVLTDEDEAVNIDAEIPPAYMEPDIFKLLDIFEPYGNENSELILLTKGITICDSTVVGKKEPLHLKLTLDTGKYKIPAMYWGQGELYKQNLIGKKCDILYKLSRNYFNGMTTNQLIISDMDIN